MRVFDQPSRNENMIIKLLFDKKHDEDLPAIVKNYLGKEVFVSWPHLSEARIIQISTASRIWFEKGSPEGIENDPRRFETIVRGFKEHSMGRLGIDVGQITTIVSVYPIVGREYIYSTEGKMTLTKTWGNIEVVYPLQAIVKDIAVHNQKFVLFKHVEDVFSVGKTVFLLRNPYYGSKGHVVDPKIVKNCGRIKGIFII